MQLGQIALTFKEDSISLKPLTFAATLPASKTSSFSNSSVLPHLIQIKWWWSGVSLLSNSYLCPASL